MINPKRLLKQLVRLHAKQEDAENWPTLQFEDSRAVFATHISADGFGKGVGFRFAVPVDQRPRFGALPNALPEGVFSVKGRALQTMAASVAKDTDELFRIEPASDNGGWVNFRVGAGAVVDLERVSSGTVYPMSAMGERAPMDPHILDELLRLKEVVKITQKVEPDSFEVLVRLGPNGAESADIHRLVIRTSACWDDDLWLSGAQLQRAGDLYRKDPAAKLSTAGQYVLLTGQNWELAMPKMKPNAEYPDVGAIVRDRAPAVARVSIEPAQVVAFLASGRIAASAMKATAPALVFCMVDGEYVVEYAAKYISDATKSEGPQRALPLDPWLRPELEQEVLAPESAPRAVALNPTYFMDAIQYLGSKSVVLEIGPDLTPVFITAGDRISVVMPMRLDDFDYGIGTDEATEAPAEAVAG